MRCVRRYGPWEKVRTVAKRVLFKRVCKKCGFETRKLTDGEKPK